MHVKVTEIAGIHKSETVVSKIAIGFVFEPRNLIVTFCGLRTSQTNKKIIYQLTRIELDVVGDLAGGNVNLHGIVGVHQRVGVTDGAAIVCHQEGNTLGTQLCLADLAQLVL